MTLLVFCRFLPSSEIVLCISCLSIPFLFWISSLLTHWSLQHSTMPGREMWFCAEGKYSTSYSTRARHSRACNVYPWEAGGGPRVQDKSFDTLSQKNKKKPTRGWRCSSQVGHLPNIHPTLSLTSSDTK